MNRLHLLRHLLVTLAAAPLLAMGADLSPGDTFKDDMRTLTSDAQPRVVLDLSSVDFIDSSGLGAIVAAMKAMPEKSRLELAGLTNGVDKVFRMTRMDSIFKIHSSYDEAVACGA